ncbi:Kem1p-like 5'-3' exonuclease [Cryptosporidium felis]|nr:Kem1p-like 5'-3' exonuclease [Cryptosporidium felis]
MGISKFYRWISERYPQINEEISDSRTPTFDNLYLDVNGIAHNSVNSNELRTPNTGANLSNKGSPEIWTAIFRYIHKLVSIAKPKRLVYIAVDGVAPRAKMNQQRSRRFRSARDSEFQRAMEEKNLVDTSSNNVFDSNCITPGTIFMEELRKQLVFFVNYQINNDPLWRGLEVILSGADVPGEGEHKIMDFIRCIKSQEDYDPNTRHCLYGLDADLIMLSLASHEPHFSLLREEVKFNHSKVAGERNVCTFEKFQFLHISILRDYIINDLHPGNLSVQELRSVLEQSIESKPYSNIVGSDMDDIFVVDNERLIDDFIILGFIVGNDFLPHIPFHTVDQGFGRIITSYKKYLAYFFLIGIKESPWLLEHCGRINYCNFFYFLLWHIISEREEAEKRISNPDYWRKVISTQKKVSTDSLGIPRFMRSNSNEIDKCRARWQETQPENFDIMRWRYYFVKMAINIDSFIPNSSDLFRFGIFGDKVNLSSEISRNSIEELVFCYLEGLQWVSYYYFRGVPSWRWYYPFRYAPFACDIATILGHWLQKGEISTLTKDDVSQFKSSKLMSINSMYSEEKRIKKIAFKFIKGTPLQPFEQLMGVLPSKSMDLLPKPFRRLFINSNSPLLHFYPSDFEVDMEGVKVPWGGVTLIPFIDESLLLNSITYVLSKDGFNDLNFGNFKFNNIECDYVSLKNRFIFYLDISELGVVIDNEIEAMSSEINGSKYLDNQELLRNTEGKPFLFYFDSSSIPIPRVESTVAGFLSSIVDSKVVSKPFHHPKFPTGVSNFPNHLLINTITPYDSFPSFKRLPFKVNYNFGVNVFGSESNSESIFLSIDSSHVSDIYLKELLQLPVNKKSQGIIVLVDYPRVKLAKLVSIKTSRFIVRPKLLEKPVIELNSNLADFTRLLSNEHSFLKKRGIILSSSNININERLLSISNQIKGKTILESEYFEDESNDLSDPINCLVEVKVVENDHINEYGEMEYEFSKVSKHFLLPLVIFVPESQKVNMDLKFEGAKMGDRLVIVDKKNNYYGCVGRIVGTKDSRAAFLIPKNKSSIEKLQRRILEYALEDVSSLQWFSVEDVSRIIHKQLLGCLTVKCGLDDSTSLNYMKYSVYFIKKLIMGPIIVKCNDNSLHEISMTLIKEDNKKKSRLCIPLYGKFAKTNSFVTSSNTKVSFGTPLVSNEAVKSIVEYLDLFPCFVIAIFKKLDISIDDSNGSAINSGKGGSGSNSTDSLEFFHVAKMNKLHVRDIFTDTSDPKDQDFKFNIFNKVLKRKIYRNAPFVDFQSNSVTMLPSTISRLEKLISDSRIDTREEFLDYSKFTSKDLIIQSGNYSNITKYSSTQGFPLGTRIIYIKGNGGVIPFGTVGTVISVYYGVRAKKEHFAVLNILFDNALLGANNLNGMCSQLRGYTIKSSDCIPLLPYIQQLTCDNHKNAINDQLKYINKRFSITSRNELKHNKNMNYWEKKHKPSLLQRNKISKSLREKDLKNTNKEGEQFSMSTNFGYDLGLTGVNKVISSNINSLSSDLESVLSINTAQDSKIINYSEYEKTTSSGFFINQNQNQSVCIDTDNSMELKLKKILKIV